MKYICFLLMFLNFSFIPYCYAGKEKEKPNIHEITRDIDAELTTIFKNKVLDFFPVKEQFPDFFEEVKKQIPEQAELLEVYLPTMSKQDLERGHYDNILGMVYFYRMPQILHKRIPLQKLQLSFVKESLEAVYQSFARVDPPAPKERNAWEEKMYENLCAGKNVYIQYKRDKGALDHIYSIMLTLALSGEHSVAAFLSHYLFLSEGQIYFLSSSSYLLDNNYYEVLQWTRSVLHNFIVVIPFDMFPENTFTE
ncbi:MAG TPA: hypothetical protein DEB43_00695 [Desulfovibrio sp.]|nr:hypothetical protein [Mailhella sp.]HBV41145.1 hypothetical protein [Desulfovibrio sp.]